jgi:tRNA(Ile)-lysidine synthase
MPKLSLARHCNILQLSVRNLFSIFLTLCVLALMPQDSMCLLQLLWELRKQVQLELAVAHCDHRVRPDSQANAAFVEAAAARLGLPFALRVAGDEQDLSKEVKRASG